ncbi:DNA-binding protein [Oceanobacter mangrovi]|uniref:baseplate complex protein n=1 Tax=Oceanobacter mangrovi TaxID=2862510 RepID=UPI001C8CFEED|nr:DNA-binding protein [Oceanobacter mangrovi]
MILERDGTTTEIRLKDLKVSVKLPIKNEDASGTGSGTATLNSGTKAKTLSVAGRLPFNSADHLTELVKLAEALTDAGTRAIYNITETAADAVQINRVQFNGDFDARPIDGLMAWAVTFGLTEYQSTAERVEAQRLAGYTSAGTETDSASGTAATGTETDSSTESDGIDRDSLLYKIAASVENYLAELDADE